MRAIDLVGARPETMTGRILVPSSHRGPEIRSASSIPGRISRVCAPAAHTLGSPVRSRTGEWTPASRTE